MRTFLILLALLAAPRLAAADVVLEVSGTYLGPNDDNRIGLTYSSDGFDGTSDYDPHLPNLFDLDRLAGGTFIATLRFPTPAASGSGSAYYNFPPGNVAARFTLFDAAGAVVHRGETGPGAIGLGNVYDNDYGLDAVHLETGAFDLDTTITGLRIPPPLGGETDIYGGAGVFFESNDLTILSGTAIPTDEAVYRRLAGIFVASAGVDTFSPAGDQYQEVLSGVSYRITDVRVATVPEPSSVVLALIGGMATLGLARRGTAGR